METILNYQNNVVKDAHYKPCLCHKKRPPKKTALDTLELTSDFRQKNESKKVLENRQNAKAISKSLNGSLCYLDSPIKKDYQAAYYCNDYLFQDGNKIIGNFCKKRNCLICSRLQSAKLFKAYAPPLLSMENMYMVTLTAPTVKSEVLKQTLKDRYIAFTKIKDNLRKTHKIKIKGFRKTEITFNKKRNEYHAHFHIIVQGKKESELLLTSWLYQFKDANIKAQNIKPINDQNALLELFKYVTKPITKDNFSPTANDIIFQSIKGVRCFQSFGIKKESETQINDYESMIIEHKSERLDVWKWCKQQNDWYTSEGEPLVEKKVTKKTRKLINIISQSNEIKENSTTPDNKKSNDDYQFKRPEQNGSRKIAYFDD